jgi:hypothetical protein
MDFDKEVAQSIDAPKKEYGIKQATELLKFLIKTRYAYLDLVLTLIYC